MALSNLFGWSSNARMSADASACGASDNLTSLLRLRLPAVLLTSLLRLRLPAALRAVLVTSNAATIPKSFPAGKSCRELR